VAYGQPSSRPRRTTRPPPWGVHTRLPRDLDPELGDSVPARV